MPAYANNPFQKTQLLQKGVAAYLLGSFSHQDGNGNFAITNLALTSNVGVVTVQLITGPLPIVGNYISLLNNATIGTVSRAVITATTVSASTGAGTITFAFTHADIPTAAATGQVVVEPAEVGEAIVNGASVACVVAAPEGDSQFTLPVVVRCPSLPTAATIDIQGAIKNIDAEFTTLGTVGTVAGGVLTAGPFGQVVAQRGYVYRFNVSGVSGGTNPTIIAKIG